MKVIFLNGTGFAVEILPYRHIMYQYSLLILLAIINGTGFAVGISPYFYNNLFLVMTGVDH